MSLNPIKSCRVYIEQGMIKIDFRTQKSAPLPAGKSDNRFRLSTGKTVSKTALKEVEKIKEELSLAHYKALMSTPQNKECVLFSDIAEKALEEAAVNRRKVDGTLDYQRILNKDILPTFGAISMKEIKPAHIKRWQVKMAEGRGSQSRFNKRFTALKTVLDYAHVNGFIDTNPISAVNRNSPLLAKAVSNSMDYFSIAEREKILNSLPASLNKDEIYKHTFILTFLHVALLIGARTGEIMCLKWKDINFENGLITIERSIRKGIISTTKTGTTRTVPMVKRLKGALEKWREQSRGEYLFPVRFKGSPYTDSRSIVDTMFKPLLKRLNIPFRKLYSTRATFASLAIEQGISVAIVSLCLGHSTTATTQRYYVRFGHLDATNTRLELEKIA